MCLTLSDFFDLEKVTTEFCKVGNVIHKHNESWQDCCNTCMCLSGNIICSKKLCAPNNCYDKRRTTNCTCIPKLNADCITPPCEPWGECAAKVAMSSTEACMPEVEKDKLTVDCAKLVIVFERKLLPPVSASSCIILCAYTNTRITHAQANKKINMRTLLPTTKVRNMSITSDYMFFFVIFICRVCREKCTRVLYVFIIIYSLKFD